MTTTPEWTPAHIDQVRALVERLRHELAEHDDGVWVGIGSAIVTLVPSALDELSRLQAENQRLTERLAAAERMVANANAVIDVSESERKHTYLAYEACCEDAQRLRAVMEAARQVHTVGSTEERAEEDVWMQAFYGLHHALRAYDAQDGGQS